MRRLSLPFFAVQLFFVCLFTPLAQAQNGIGTVPFFDLARKPERPDISGIRAIRFLTDDDYPPFHFNGADGQLTGFNVDLARAICIELRVACTIQARRWDTLLSALEEGRGDAVIASLRANESDREKFSFSVPYYRSPARFVVRKDRAAERKIADTSVRTLEGKAIAATSGSAHAAFLAAFFPRSAARTAPDQSDVLRLLVRGDVDAAFGDGVSLSLWLNGAEGSACCEFLGGAFFESRYFGEGAAIAFQKNALPLRRAVDYALFRLVETGQYHALLLKYFPVSFY